MRAIPYIRDVLSRTLEGMGLSLPERASVEPPKDKAHGDLACNCCMLLAKEVGKPPRVLAEEIRAGILGSEPSIADVQVAGPGFLNFFLAPAFWQNTVAEVLAAGERYGASDMGRSRKVQVEYVSANPTGPLHIGHGRGAALGDSLARILRFSGHDVETEYYINDAGRQMRLLGTAVWVRYQQHHGRAVELPEDCYKGDYIMDVAVEITREVGDSLLSRPEEEALAYCQEFGMLSILAGIKQDLADFRVGHDVWFSEKKLVETGLVEASLDRLREEGLAYDKDGALWFNTTRYGDDKDRVLRKSTGELTYFASDIAYHDDKYRRGFDLVVDIWGADHHGYVPRMKAAVQALGKTADQLQVILVQLVSLLRAGEQIAMSTRAGQFETLADVVKEVGADSARFIFLSRKSDSHLDFDLDLVKQQSMENPVYYVQYAHARIRSVFRKAQENGVAMPEPSTEKLALLATPEDLEILKLMAQFPETVEAAARSLSPHHVSFYIRELAGQLHRYYTVHQVLGAGSPDLMAARLLLLSAVAVTLKAGLSLLGVSAPESM